MTDDVERALALSYARPAHREALTALFSLDDRLGQVLRTSREPLLGQMRLTWWHDAIESLDRGPAPDEPVLQALAAHVVPARISGGRVARMIEGWEVLLDPEASDDAALSAYAESRGGILFGAAAAVIGASQRDPVAAAGAGWALVDLAWHVRERAVATRARALAGPLLDAACAARWSRDARVLGALAHLARLDLAIVPNGPRRPGAPRRVARMAWHRLTGR